MADENPKFIVQTVTYFHAVILEQVWDQTYEAIAEVKGKNAKTEALRLTDMLNASPVSIPRIVEPL